MLLAEVVMIAAGRHEQRAAAPRGRHHADGAVKLLRGRKIADAQMDVADAQGSRRARIGDVAGIGREVVEIEPVGRHLDAIAAPGPFLRQPITIDLDAVASGSSR